MGLDFREHIATFFLIMIQVIFIVNFNNLLNKLIYSLFPNSSTNYSSITPIENGLSYHYMSSWFYSALEVLFIASLSTKHNFSFLQSLDLTGSHICFRAHSKL